MEYHVVDFWKTPASGYPRRQIGEWAITTRRQEPGIYRLQNHGAFYYHAKPIDLTVLTEGEKVWFTDEPRNMYALAEIGLFRAYGHVVVGGLGLGLIHHFLKMNSRVEWVVTIERAVELAALVWPYTMESQLITGDFYKKLPELAEQGYHVDTIITDFIFGYQSATADLRTEETWQELQEQRAFCQRYYPDALFLEHGYQRRLDAEVVAAEVPMSKLVPEGTLFDKVQVVR